jgi:hypothetical protein
MCAASYPLGWARELLTWRAGPCLPLVTAVITRIVVYISYITAAEKFYQLAAEHLMGHGRAGGMDHRVRIFIEMKQV